MSAIAFSSTHHNIFLLSDGRSANEHTPDKTASTDCRKVWKVNSNVGMAWIGYYPYKGIQNDLLESLKESGQSAPKDLAAHTQQFMDDTLTAEHYMKMKGPNRFRYCIIIVGYQNGQPMIYQIDSEKDETKAIPFPPGNNAFMGYDKDVSDGERYEQALQRYNDIAALYGPEMVVRSAFQEVINYWNGKGKPVGGEIFSEVLIPEGKSIFKEAIRKN